MDYWADKVPKVNCAHTIDSGLNERSHFQQLDQNGVEALVIEARE